jgi:hypothetical protein
MCFLRCYNGNLYDRGTSKSGTYSKVHKDEIVRLVLNMDEGTLSYTINEEDKGVAFTNLTGEVFPAIATYRNNISVRLLSVHGPGLSGRIPYHHNLVADPSVRVLAALTATLQNYSAPVVRLPYTPVTFLIENVRYHLTGNLPPCLSLYVYHIV